MNLFRVYGDNGGETHLARIDLPPLQTQADGHGDRLALRNIPTTTMNITELLGPKLDQGFHTIPRRQMVVVLRGALEITTSTGECQRLDAGDCLLAEDADDTQGHRSRDVGSEPLVTLVIGIAADWKCPVAESGA